MHTVNPHLTLLLGSVTLSKTIMKPILAQANGYKQE